jgi:hypothetical protein
MKSQRRRGPYTSRSGDIYDVMWKYLWQLEKEPTDSMLGSKTKEQYHDAIRKNYWRFEGVPASVMEKQMEKYPMVYPPTDRHNYSPMMRDMVELAKKYKGTMEGYAIPPESGREDSRVTTDGMTLAVDAATANKLRKRYKPDEFDEVAPGKWRFWWD